jgi:hypothetical protein
VVDFKGYCFNVGYSKLIRFRRKVNRDKKYRRQKLEGRS